MGGHNRPCPSLEWTGVDGEQIVWKNGSCDAQFGAGSLCLPLRVSCGVLPTPGWPWECHAPVWGFDSSKRAGIRCLQM